MRAPNEGVCILDMLLISNIVPCLSLYRPLLKLEIIAVCSQSGDEENQR